MGGFFGDTYQNVGMDLRFHMVYKEFSPDPLKIPKIPFLQKCPFFPWLTISIRISITELFIHSNNSGRYSLHGPIMFV